MLNFTIQLGRFPFAEQAMDMLFPQLSKLNGPGMEISESTATIIATVAAIGSAFASINAANSAARLSAKQNVLGADIKLLSKSLYEIVALCAEARKSKSSEKFSSKIEAATEVARTLDRLRQEHRYSLPFIFDPIWHLKGIPLYVSHYKNALTDPRVDSLIKKATRLREAIDECLEFYFFHGKSPSLRMRLKLRCRSRSLTKEFKKGKYTE
ncbi:hypothetical protein L0V05_02880 [Tabrizicola sp. J26]|uniref:hypothetical protein n=1 Tax=Alitabrizicola rongguiensis TaxID=2909234 RepID=UPI001F29CBBD|nr:hypothetical protein [Tabrizicola rongguiensis]MCF1707754.1 hypothetical protein [Tabrizicola rongguiensis]